MSICTSFLSIREYMLSQNSYGGSESLDSLFEKICYIILEVPVRFVKKTSKKYINWLLFFCKRCKILVKQSANQYKNSTRNRLQMRRGRKFGEIREKTKKKDNRV